ncbi:MAG: diguanylate cyclase [Desulfotalea sp.]
MKENKKRRGIAATLSIALGTFVFALVVLSSFALYGFFEFNKAFKLVSNDSIPRIIIGSRLNELVNRFVLGVERFSLSTSDTEHRIVYAEIEKTVSQIHKEIEKKEIDELELQQSLSILKATLAESNEIVLNRIETTRKVNRSTALLFEIPEDIFRLERDIIHIQHNEKVLEPFLLWARSAVGIITLASQGHALDTLYEIRQLDGQLRYDFAALQLISMQMPDAVQAQINPIEQRLYSVIMGPNGIVPLLIQLSRISSQSMSRSNITRSLIKNFETSNVNMFNSILNSTVDRTNGISQLIKNFIWIFSILIAMTGIFVIWVLFFINRKITKRLIRLNTAIFEESPHDVGAVKEIRNDEISDMAGSFLFYVNEVKKREDQFKKLATIDSLTGIYNRRYFTELTQKELEKSQRYKYSSVFLMMDIDKFKVINDTYGHPVGDIILKSVSCVIQSYMRDADILSRLGGEEFGVFLPHTELDEGLQAAERLRKAIEEEKSTVGGELIVCTISIGLAESVNGKLSLEGLMKQADDALYKAKNAGRNCVVAA